MSQTSIGRAALVLTTNGSGLRSGLDKEGQGIKKWADDTGKTVGAKLKDVGAPKGATGGLGLAASLGAVAAPAAAAAAAIATVKSAADTLQDLGRQGDLATALGVSAQQFTGLAGVFNRFGIDAQGTSDVLTDVADWIQDAAVNGGELAETFGFLGVNAKELNGLRPDQQFLALADAFQKIDPTLAAGLAARLGGDFQKLLPVLRQGSGAIQSMGADFAVSARDMESARVANQALTQAGTALGQAWRAISVALAPVITLIGKGISAAVGLARPALQAYASYSQWVFGIASRVWNGITDIISRVWDRIMARAQPVFDWLTSAWESVQEVAGWVWEGILSIVVPVVEQVVSAVEQAIDAVASWTAELLAFTGNWPTAREVVIAAFRGIGTAAAYAWDVIRAGNGIMATVAGGIVEALGSVVVAFRDVIADMIRMAKSLPKALAFTSPVLAGLRQLDENAVGDYGAKIQEAGKQLKEWGAAAVADFGGSAQQFNTWLDRMVARQKTATAEVKKEQAKVVAAATNQLAGPALIKGTSAEVSARLKYEFGGKGTPEKQLAETQKQTGVLGQILGAAQSIAGKPAGVELVPM
ncbi:hypothetical protein R5W23_000846 [Gemmata sp. JC673]|uniref:Phage tail tape measure protein n=1 Tax=Gemmata algarum TaxID=2975278 RepID=A0ABU5ESJ8_9BACT|nr:hypothetical protein [Gemmata algarum]MDY3558125.1 hypothetical protein [Gemmata algarum]